MFTRSPLLLFSAVAAAASSLSSVALSGVHYEEPSTIGVAPPSESRKLQPQAALNSILSSIELRLPDKQISTNGVDITITELVCSEISVQDVNIVHSIISKQTQRIDFALEGLRSVCHFQWNYQWTFFSGKGTGSAEIGDNSRIAAALDFVSKDFDFHPPKDVNIAHCQKDGIKVVDILFEGDGLGFVGDLMNSFEESFRGTVNEEVGEEVCEEMIELSDDAFEDILLALSDRLENYLIPSTSSEIHDPLYLESGDIDIPTDEDGISIYVNFQELDQYANGMVQTAIDKVSGMLGNNGRGSGSGSELGINAIIRDNLLNEDGLLAVEHTLFSTSGVMFEVRDKLMETIMTIQSVHVGGLDSFQYLDFLNPIGKHTLQNSMRLEKLSFMIEMEAIMKASSAPQNVEPVKERFSMTFDVEDIEVDFSIFLGVNRATLGNLQLGSILRIDDIMPCVFSAIDQSTFTKLSVSVPYLLPPTLSGFSDDGLNEIVSVGAEAMFHMYDQVLLRAMPSFFQTFVQQMLNDFITDQRESVKCPDPSLGSAEIVDFRDLLLPASRAAELLGNGDSRYGDLLRLIYGFVEGFLSDVNEEGLLQINDMLVSPLTEGQSNVRGELFYSGNLLNQKMKIDLNGLNADILLRVSDVKISHLDSLGAPMQLLQPVKGEASVLNNEAWIGVGPEALRASFKLLIKGEGAEVNVSNELEVGLSLSSANMILELLAEMEESSFLNFQLQNVMNHHCWIATIVTPLLDKYGVRIGEADSGLVLKKLALAVAEARLHIDCISCSSPILMELSSYFSSEKGVSDTTSVANKLFSYGSELLTGGFMQAKLDRMLNEAALKCPHMESYDPDFRGFKYDPLVVMKESEDSYGFLIAIISVMGVVIVMSTMLYMLAKCVSSRRHSRWMKTLTHDQLLQLEKEQKDETKRKKDLNKRMRAMICSNEVPLFVRLFIPIVIVGNIALFASGHLSLGGTVNISGNFAGQEFNVDGFFEFSMLKSTIQMWEAGATELAIMIAIFSGVWPYTKQLITLFAWFASPTLMSSQSRGRVLRWLDILAKWSMVDVFVLLLTLASFRISIASPDDLAFLPENLYSINLLVVPLWGLYSNFLAQLVSQVSSHIIIHYHRKAVMAATQAQQIEWNIEGSSASDSTPQILRNHSFKLDYEASSKNAIVRKWVDGMLSVALVAFMGLLVCGGSLPSFDIEVLGLLGLAVESGNGFQEADVYYSVFSLAKMIMDQARYLATVPDYIGLGALSSMLVITVFLVPLFQALTLLFQWFAPINKQQRHMLTVVSEILSAWQYMEVYVLSIVITAWQISGVSEFMLNAYCGSLSGFFARLSYFGILKDEDAQCFSVNATVQTASWLLVAASVLLFVLNHFIMSASMQKAQDENIPVTKRLHSDRWQLFDIQSSASSSTEESMDEEQARRKIAISPVSPRFTDYYFIFTTKTDGSQTSSDTSISIHSGDGKIASELMETDTTHIEKAIVLWDL